MAREAPRAPGGVLTVRVKTHKGQATKAYYRCLTNVQRGKSVCSSHRGIPHSSSKRRGNDDGPDQQGIQSPCLVPPG